MVLTDAVLRNLPPVQIMLESLPVTTCPTFLSIGCAVEPTDQSFLEAINFARENEVDSFVAQASFVPGGAGVVSFHEKAGGVK
jgi:hydroxyacid-oxoacid transhydrogenase